MDEIDLRVRRDVDTFGWHVAKIAGDDAAPPWAFSIGLEERFAHPEVVVFGMELDVLHRLVNHVGDEVRRGRVFVDGERAERVLAHHPPVFRSVRPCWHEAFLGNAGWFYRGRPFRALQCFWPDANGALPWEPGFDAAWQGRQPFLFEEDEARALGPGLAAVLRAE
ncbi:MAG: DUF4262 domain-containing protein, partial [Myxococcales bacterium]|nr:DUF4262 domain-containing protein [Myxococcales bacterium]